MPSKERGWSVCQPSRNRIDPIVDRKARSQSVPTRPPLPVEYQLTQPDEADPNDPRPRRGRKKWRPDKFVECYYPQENLRLATETEGTMKAVCRKVIDVIGDTVVQVDVPVQRMAEFSKKVHMKLLNIEAPKPEEKKIPIKTRKGRPKKKGRVKLPPYGHRSPMRDHQASNERVMAALDEILEKKDVADFEDELERYALIGCTQLEKLSLGSLMSMVIDVCKDETNLTEYEKGYPPRFAPSLYKYYNLGETEFSGHSEQDRDIMLKNYITEAIRYQKDMKVFIEEKYESLLKKGEMLDGSEQQEEWFRTFEKNQKMGRSMKKEYERICLKEDMARLTLASNGDDFMEDEERASKLIEVHLPVIPNDQTTAKRLEHELNTILPSNIHIEYY